MSRPGLIKWLPNFIRAFGPWHGLRLFLHAAWLLGRGGEGGHDEVAAVTIEEILAQTGEPCALVVKVDIEGGEAALFEGEAGWLDRVELLAIDLHDWLYPWQGTSDTFFAQIGRRRLDHLFRGENLFCFGRPPASEAPGIDT